ncbi:MAG: glutathione S-transferase [Gammaproteobacteria bacterium]|nr:glutathione S-transferase [Gammaproteobacteria bacterium]
MSNSIVIHSFPLSGHSHRVILFCSLAGIPYEIVNVDLAGGEHKQEKFLSLNPDGQIPVIEDGDTVVTDSNAILVYLARKYAPSFLPTDFKQEAEVQRFLTMAAGEIAFGVAAARLINVFNAPLDVDYVHQIGINALNKLEAHLKDREFLVGNQLSIADIAIYSYIAHAPEGGISLEPYSNVRRLLKTIENQKYFVAMQVTNVGLLA